MHIDPLGAFIVISVALIIFSFRMSAYLMKRAVCTVVSIFRDHNAIHAQNARTLEELGLVTRLFKILRDYKPYALQALTQSSIIRNTPDGRFYLVEENPVLGNVQCPVNVKGVKSNKLTSLFRKK